MSDDTLRETPADSAPTTSAPATSTPTISAGLTTSTPVELPDASDASDTDDDGPGAAPELGPDGLPKRRRRRGSRGGRNRKKPGTATTSGSTNGVVGADDEDDEDDEYLAENENEVGADRGLTTEDVAAVAMEDAGLVEPGIVHPPVTPQVGDRRPAPGGGRARGEHALARRGRT